MNQYEKRLDTRLESLIKLLRWLDRGAVGPR